MPSSGLRAAGWRHSWPILRLAFCVAPPTAQRPPGISVSQFAELSSWQAGDLLAAAASPTPGALRLDEQHRHLATPLCKLLLQPLDTGLDVVGGGVVAEFGAERGDNLVGREVDGQH